MFKRKKLNEIKPYLYTNDIIVIHGARQVGKTSLMKLIIKELPKNDLAYLDLEDSRFFDICEKGAEEIFDYLKQKGVLKQQERFFLFIDEIQYLTNPSSLLKIIHDHYPKIKLIVSGSSSFEIKSKFKDSLVGRTVNFEIFPLDFEEFLLFKESSIDINQKITIESINNELTELYREFITYGGYPKIILTPSIEMKERYLQQIIDTYIKQDIRDLAKIRNIEKFNRLIHILAAQSGQMLNIKELSNTTKLAKQTIEEYLFILENTYVIKILNPYSKNIRSELFKTPKIFFYDTGLLNMLYLKALPSEINGHIYETSVFSELVKLFGKDNIKYWRTQDKKEIDFILIKKNEVIPIEVKINASNMKYTAIKYFSNKYNIENRYCISLKGELYPKKGFTLTNIKPWEIKRL